MGRGRFRRDVVTGALVHQATRVPFDRVSATTSGGGGVTSHNDLTDVTPDQHHPQVHGLVGGDHTVSGLTTGQVLTALSATTFGFQAAAAGYSDEQAQDAVGAILLDTATVDFTYDDTTPTISAIVVQGGISLANLGSRPHSALTGIGANDHHNQSHVLATNTALGADHTISGVTAGQVLRASAATAANFQALAFSDLSGSLAHSALTGVTADQHHAQSHVLATTSGLGADHTTSGLTAGQVLRASGATTAAFASLNFSDLAGTATDAQIPNTITLDNLTQVTTRLHSSLQSIGADDHHAQSHVLATTAGLGADHTTSGLTAGQVLRATAATTAAFQTLAAADIGSGAALTRTSDTNVTLTLGGTPTTALLAATSITAGWAGQLGLSRGGTNADLSATGGTSQVLKQVTAGAAVTVAQLAFTDISGSVTDAQVPDTITLSNLTQITTRPHSSLTGFTTDDHTIYALLAGRSGGQTQIGDTASGGNYTVQSTSHATRGLVNVTDELRVLTSQRDIVGGAIYAVRWDASNNVTDGVGSFRAFALSGTINQTATAVFNSHKLFLLENTYNVQSGAVLANTSGLVCSTIFVADGVNVTSGGVLGVVDETTFTRTGGSTMTGVIQETVRTAPTVKAGVILAAIYGHRIKDFADVGAVTTQAGLYVENITKATTNLSVLSDGSAVQLRHAGPVRIGDTSAATEKLEVSGNMLLTGSLYGDTVAGGTLDLRPSSAANFTGTIDFGKGAGDYGTAGSPILCNLWPDGATFGGGTMLSFSALRLNSTITQNVNAVIGLPLIQLFYDSHTHDPSGSGVTLMSADISFYSGPTIRNTHTANITAGLYRGLHSEPTITTTSSGTLTFTECTHVLAAGTIGTGVTITDRRGLWMKDTSGAGTLTTVTAVDIDNLTDGTTNLSLRSAGTAVQLRHAGPAAFGVNGAPATTCDVNGDLATRAANLALVNGNNDNIAIGARSFIRITGPTGAFTIRGIASGFDGKRLTLYNTTAQNMTINHEDANSTAANRLRTMTAGNLASTGEAAFEFIYDATQSRWLCTNASAV